MKLALTTSLGILLASCGGHVGAENINDSVHRYFELPNRILAVLDQNKNDEDLRLDLASVASNCCTGRLKEKLLQWFAETPTNSGGFFDDIWSMQPINVPECMHPVLKSDGTASINCLIQTSETYSLARNLENLSDLYVRFDIRNMTLEELTTQVNAHDLPELVELELHVQKTVELQLHAVSNGWLVSDAEISPKGARIEVRWPG